MELDSKKMQFIMLGDCNIDVCNRTNEVTQIFSEMLTTFHLKWLVNTPTRVKATSTTAIHNVITNLTNTRDKITKTTIADHDAQEAVIRDCPPREELPHSKVGRNVCRDNLLRKHWT